MDYQDAPDLNLTKEQLQKHEAEMKKFLEMHDLSVKQRIQELKDAGYSDDEIENIFAF
ncbi:hypothetical protein GF325_07360 [Candidatus Bathyarchaeota archaeon]|nr:hypothetical protein [Candidatus Bathyarchaeota archaeon]